MEIDIELSRKQWIAWEALEDDRTTEVLFGGGAGGGKSWLGCLWHVSRRLRYPKSKGLIARGELTTLRDSTM